MEEKKSPLNWTNIIFLVITPLFALIAAPIYIHYHGYHLSDFLLLFISYWLTGIGITMGYHRLFTHQTYKAHPIVKFFLPVLLRKPSQYERAKTLF